MKKEMNQQKRSWKRKLISAALAGSLFVPLQKPQPWTGEHNQSPVLI